MKINPSFIFHVLIYLFPILFLTLRGWVNALLIIIGIMAVYLYIYENRIFAFKINIKKYLWIIVLFLLPITGVALGQIFRLEFIARDYDGPSRMLLAGVIFFAILRFEINFKILKSVFEISIPVSLYVTLFVSLFYPYKEWGVGRLTTYFVDPLTFGSMCLALATVSFTSINLFKKDTVLMRAFKIGSIFAGIYLSILSGSRTGWIGFPIIIFTIILLRFRSSLNFNKLIILLVSLLIAVSVLFNYVTPVNERVVLALSEIMNYQWHGQDNDTSVGIRISLLRMTWFYFQQSPLAGWGDFGFTALMNAPEIVSYTTQSTRLFAATAGFHNEIAANMVRSGIWGLISILGVFLIPLAIFISYVKSKNVIQHGFSVIGIGYVLCTIINGMTTEVFNLKYCVSFYAFMMAILLGGIFRSEHVGMQSSPRN